MSENINPESVRGLLEGTTPGPWKWNGSAMLVSEKTTLFRDATWWNGKESDRPLIAAAPSIARAYLALSERVTVLEGALRPFANAVARHDDTHAALGIVASPDDDSALELDDVCDGLTLAEFRVARAALSHKGMDHG